MQWKILASAAKFLAFLGGYTIFLGPMTSILITEYVSSRSSHTRRNPANSCPSYFIVRRERVSVPDMYNFHGIYRYSPRYATNWRAVAAFFIGCIPPLPGFVDNIIQAGDAQDVRIKDGISLGGRHL